MNNNAKELTIHLTAPNSQDVKPAPAQPLLYAQQRQTTTYTRANAKIFHDGNSNSNKTPRRAFFLSDFLQNAKKILNPRKR
jgi:hypothetical protein